MKFFPPPVEIAEDEGFAPQKDLFQRAPFGDGLTNLVTVAEDPLVIMLDSAWGTGKTTFIKMWAGQLRNAGFPVIYFDAFENDHVDNGFLAITAEVLRFSQSKKNTNATAHKKFLRSAARAGGVLLRTGARIGVKAATLGAIDATDLDALKSVADDIAKEASTKADEYIEVVLRLQSQEKEALTALRAALVDLAKSLSSQTGEGSTPKPLIFIIDELDRCRPSFALELLERIKHIFSIKNVHFVLAAHLDQLENSVRFNYGEGLDARTYLEKFYNIIAHFPDSSRSVRDKVSNKYISYLVDKMSLQPGDLTILNKVAEARSLSFRTIERVVTCISLARQFTPKNHLWLQPIVSGLCVMKMLDTSLFNRARAGTLTIDDVRTALSLDNWADGSKENDWMMEWWIYCVAENEADYPKFDWKGCRQSLAQYSIRDRRDLVRIMASYLDRFRLPTQ